MTKMNHDCLGNRALSSGVPIVSDPIPGIYLKLVSRI